MFSLRLLSRLVFSQKYLYSAIYARQSYCQPNSQTATDRALLAIFQSVVMNTPSGCSMHLFSCVR